MKTLLGRLLTDEGKPSEGCLSPEVAAAYMERTLTREETRAADAHLSGCSSCRRAVLFASLPPRPRLPIPEASGTRAPTEPEKLIGVRLAIRSAIGAVEALFEGSLSLVSARVREEAAPVFRGGAPEVEGVNSVVLGPYRLSLKRIDEGPKAGLYVRVTKVAGIPLTDAAAEIELESGKHVSGRTDNLGWVHIAGVALEHISAIWINAAA